MLQMGSNAAGAGPRAAAAFAAQQARAERAVAAAEAVLATRGHGAAAALLRALVAALGREAAGFADPAEVFGFAEHVALELTHAKPDRLTLRAFLTGISDETAHAPAIVAAASSLKELVTTLYR
jgi:hypothetical protein